MGMFDFIKDQLIDIIEWPDTGSGVLVHRFDRKNNEIKWHAKLVVRPGQRAVFVNEGQIADSFEPGTYTLDTKNLPVLRTLLSWPYGFESPFKAEVYFIKTTEQLDRKWGTATPVMMRDADFGMVRLRARGNYSYKIGITEDMISRFVGAKPEFTDEEIEGQIRTKIISSFSDSVGELKIPALELAAKYDEISEANTNKLSEVFKQIGIDLLSFTVENISLPDDVQKAMDQRASLGALGNMNTYTQYQAANALRDAANNPGGVGNMMGFMLGGQMGAAVSNVAQQTQQQVQQQPQQAQQQPQQAAAAPPPLPGAVTFFVAINGQQAGPFNQDVIKQKIASQEITQDSLVWKEGMANWAKAGEVAELSNLFGQVPPPLPPH